MADWKDVYSIKKRQILGFSGNGSWDINNVFNGTGVNNGQIFTMNDGAILSSVSCDYYTTWGISGTNLTAESKVKTWSTLPTLWYADINDSRNNPLYKNGYHTPITIPSGFVIYVLDVNAHHQITLYENEVPSVIQASDSSVPTGMKIWRVYYNQTANSLTLRFDATNLSYAYLSCAYIYTKTDRNVTNKAVIMEGVYSDSSLGSGITIPPSQSGGGSGGVGEVGGETLLNLQSGTVGRFGMKGTYFDFSSIKELYATTQYVGDYTNIFLAVYNYVYAKVSHFSLPFIGFVGQGVYKFDKLTGLKQIILGSKGNPVTTDGIVDFNFNSSYDVNVFVFTVDGKDLLWTCTVGSGHIYYIKS